MAIKKKATAPELVKGFKVTNPDFTCLGTQYALNQDFTLPNAPVLCDTGYHFCRVANDCFNYYSFQPDNRVFEVEAFGETVHGEDKSVTNGIRFVRELTWAEVLALVNQGKNNTGRGNSGYGNSGDGNSGNRNSGDGNSGDGNSGDGNSGDGNSGYGNSGYGNSGNRNSGDGNSGDGNSGNRNSGYGNSGDGNSGIFCTTTPKNIELFNQPSEWSLQDFLGSEAYYITQRLLLTEWRPWSEMSDHEKEQYPRAETSEGYTKKHDYKAAWATLWGELDTRERAAITSLPNFNEAVFAQITGIQPA